MMRLALIVEYEGTNYHGFQLQANASSIQGELEKALERLTGERIRVMAAGRTDTGVHARGQVVAFDTASSHLPVTFVRGLNAHLPDEIAVKAACRVRSEFDPRRAALSRTYRYTIDCGSTRSPLSRRTAYRLGDSLDVRRMRRAARYFVGRHDFSRFAGPLSRDGASTVREVYMASVSGRGDIVRFEVEANAFLPRQVRRMTGALVDVGLGRLTPGEVGSMLEGGAGDVVAHALPPTGLCLQKVAYAEGELQW